MNPYRIPPTVKPLKTVRYLVEIVEGEAGVFEKAVREHWSKDGGSGSSGRCPGRTLGRSAGLSGGSAMPATR